MSEDYLIHYGKLGMKWGVRHEPVRKSSGYRASKLSNNKKKQNTLSSLKSKAQKVLSKINKQKVKKVLKVGAIATGTVLVSSLGISGVLYADLIHQSNTIQGPYPRGYVGSEHSKTFYGNKWDIIPKLRL